MKYDKNHALLECSIPGIPQKSGKVRDVFDLGDKLLMVVTDRISAFDVILPCGVPDKGKVLNQLSLFWLEFFGVKNHLITANVDEYPAELQPYKEDLRGRSMLVKKVKMVEVECIARGYLTGSGWKEYQQSQTVNGEKLRAGYENASKLDEVLFTPTTKAAIGDHDEAINYEQTKALVGEATAQALKDATIGLYTKAADYAAQHGIIIADTKFEFGQDDDGSLILADEVLTPDSSRFWPQASYKVGANPPSLDKQYVRDWLDSINFNHQPPGPVLPDDVIARTREIYIKRTFPARSWPNVRHSSFIIYNRSKETMGMFDQVREAMKMRSEAKKIEAEIKKITAEYSNGGITVVAKGDMTIDKIAITPEAYEEVKAGKPARFETMLFNVVNGALKKARETTQQEMAKLMQANGGFGGLFGK